MESLCQNHPFVDGNKRVVYASAGVFLQQNGWAIEAETEDAISLMFSVASGKLRKEEMRIWIEEHAVPCSLPAMVFGTRDSKRVTLHQMTHGRVRLPSGNRA